MITFRVKMLNGHFMWDAPMQKRRSSDKDKRRFERINKKLKRNSRYWLK